jgi:hypothetical protein
VTTDNYIIVGVTEPGPYTPTDKSTRALLIFGMDGKQQHTYQYDSNKHRLFTLPEPDFVKSFISELLNTDRSMSLFDVNVMSKISQEICFVVVMLSLSMFICLMTWVWMVNNNILINMTVTITDCLLDQDVSQQIITKT